MRRMCRTNRVLSRLVTGAALGSVMVSFASRSDRAERAKRGSAQAGAIQLQIDETYAVDERLLKPGRAPASPLPQTNPGSPDSAADSAERISVLVHMDPVLTRGANQRAKVKAFAANRGGFTKYEYNTALPNVLNLRNLTRAQVHLLRNLPGVARVEEDEFHANVLRLHDSTPLIGGLQSQVAAANFLADGAGIRVCVVDTGIDTDHIMYADRIDFAAGYDFHNDDPDPEDDHGHGSHVSGIILGGTGLSADFGCDTGSHAFQGVAPGATLIGVKVLNRGGGGFDSNIIAGIDHCADQSPSGARADVINMSIGTGNFISGGCTHVWAVAANNAAANGVVAVAAAGNENSSNSMNSPACGADVIAVGATWKADYPTCEDNRTTWNWGSCTDPGPQTDDIACFSNESDFLDVSAPGAKIWSAGNAEGGTSIVGMSGTSMACPQVVGLAALVLDLDPSLTPAEVRQIIRDGAVDMGSAGFDLAYGWGRIDVLRTLALVDGRCTPPADCDDGLFCNGVEDCVGETFHCVPGTPVDCDDGIACTDDSCNEDTDSCDNIANDANCDDGLFCNGAETCSGGACQAGVDPCPGQGCDDDADVCVSLDCNNNGTCESGEDCDNCPNDCPAGSGASCGNGICETADGEDCSSCPDDCNGKLNGRPSGRYCCGDGSAPNGVTCSDNRCTGGGNTCTIDPAVPSCCGDGSCDASEDSFNCELDCGPPPVCGDGSCDAGEDQCACAVDCGTPPATEANCTDGVDNDCDGQTDGADPDCACGAKGDQCTLDSDCCSFRCKGNGTCR